MNDFNKTLIDRFSKDRGEKLIPLFGVMGIFIGVFAIIFVMSIMRGFQEQLINRIIGTQAHMYINAKDNKQVLNNWKELINKIDEDANINELFISPYIETESIALFENVTVGNIIFAVNNAFLNKLFKKKDINLEERQVYVGNQFAVINNIFETDELSFISAWDLIKSKVPRQRKFKVKGTLKTGSYARDLKYVYMNIDDASKYFSVKKKYPNGLALIVDNPNLVHKYKKHLLNNYENLSVQTWQDRNQKLFYSLKIERLAMLFTLIFIIIVASFSIISSLVLFVESKNNQFAVLFSLGFSKKYASKILFKMSLIKGLKGAVTGGIVAWILIFCIKKYNLISLPEIYYDNYLPVKIDVFMNVLIITMSVLICVLGSIYPIRKMKKISITKLLRKN